MITRVALLFGIFTSMGVGGYLSGHMREQHGHASHHAPAPHEHPIQVALEARTELQLSAAQIGKLEAMRAALAKDLEPVHKKLEAIHREAMQAHEAGNQERHALLEKEAKLLGDQVKPAFHRYALEVGNVLTAPQKEKLMAMVQERMAKRGSRDFMLMYVMNSREQLGITPKQFTELQLMQSEFLRAFAPLREQLEELHAGGKNSGKGPSKELIAKAESLHAQVQELQAKFSHRATQEVLTKDQRTKLGQMVQSDGGHHRGSHGGGQSHSASHHGG